MPRRSRGCHLCRRRKVRCDETRPQCQRCITYGTACPGYRTKNANDVEFRYQNPPALQPTGGITSRDSSSSQRKDASSSSQLSFRFVDGALRRPASLQSPSVNRMQLYSEFMSLYFPSDIPEGVNLLDSSHHSYMCLLVSLPSSQSALTYGLDALSLVQIGSIHKDRHMVHQALQSYTYALSSLARILHQPGSVNNDIVLAAAVVLSSCEFFDGIKQGTLGWVSHHDGIRKLVSARGPGSLNSRLSMLLFCQAISKSLASSFVLRRRDFSDSPRWRSISSLNAGFSKTYHTGVLLPALLERHDALDMNSPYALLEVDALLTDCLNLEGQMKMCAAQTQHSLDGERNHWPELADIEQFHPFSRLVTDRALDKAFQFSSFFAALQLSQGWLRMFLLRENIRSLHRMRQLLDPSWKPRSDQEVDDNELTGYIVNMFRCIPFFAEGCNGLTGHMACFFPLYLGHKYLKATQNTEWVRWIREVNCSIFNCGMSMPPIAAAELRTSNDDEVSNSGPSS